MCQHNEASWLTYYNYYCKKDRVWKCLNLSSTGLKWPSWYLGHEFVSSGLSLLFLQVSRVHRAMSSIAEAFFLRSQLGDLPTTMHLSCTVFSGPGGRWLCIGSRDQSMCSTDLRHIVHGYFALSLGHPEKTVQLQHSKWKWETYDCSDFSNQSKIHVVDEVGTRWCNWKGHKRSNT